MSYQHARRVPVAGGAQARARQSPFSGPIVGWVVAANLADAPEGSALVLDNFFPTQRGILPRGGTQRWATLGGLPLQRLISYTVPVGSKFFAADQTHIYDITAPADPMAALTALIAGLTSGYWSYQQITTSGGTFLSMVNGADPMLVYDGANLMPVGATVLQKLDYNLELSPFIVGRVLTGATSGAVGTIVKVIDNGATGTLWIDNVTGVFVAAETITGASSGGSAKAVGTNTTLIGAITGQATSTLSHVNLYRNRLYFVEKNTMDLHYLPVDSITGALGQRSLGGIFKLGGAILFTATWSLDAGEGLDDKFVAVSTEGEVAIFQGGNPAGAAPGDFDLVGVYQIGKPLGKHCHIRAGGDLICGTVDGLVPMSVAINKDKAALSLSAVSHPIEPEWQRQYRVRPDPWEAIMWPLYNFAAVAVPTLNPGDDKISFVVNVEMGSWARYTNHDARCLGIHEDRFFFGTTDGLVIEGETTGRDGADPYFPLFVGHAQHLKAPGTFKTVHSMRATWRGSTPMSFRLSASMDYNIKLGAFPSANADDATVGWDISLWDVGLWDEGTVAAEQSVTVSRWSSVGRSGYSVNPQIQMTVNSSRRPDNELITYDLIHEDGGGMV